MESEIASGTSKQIANLPQFLNFGSTGFVVSANGRIFEEDNPIHVALNVVNRSAVGVARDVYTAGGTAFIPADNETNLSVKEEDQFQQFRRFTLSMLPKMTGDEIAAGDNRVRDAVTKPLRKRLIRALQKDESVYFYVFGIVKWTDDEGTWETQTCSHLLVKRSNLREGQAIWKECVSGVKHNFTRHPFVP